MGYLFFNHHNDFETVKTNVFKALGLVNYLEGESVNVLGGVYGSFSIFGLKIKLELNSYDHEDDYKYMLSIDEDFLSDLKIDKKIEENVTETIAILLHKNLSITIALEIKDGLKLFSS